MAAPDVGQVDILNIAADGTVSELTKNLDFSDFSDAFDVPAAAYTIGVDLDDDQRAELFFELPELEAGTIANVFVSQDSNDSVVAYAQLEGPTTAVIVPATTSL